MVHLEETLEEVHHHHSPAALPLNQFTIVNFDKQQLQEHSKKKKKKKIIIQEDDDWDEADSETDYVILKSPSGGHKSGAPFHRKEELTMMLGSKANRGKPLLINLDDFDDKRILQPSVSLAPHFDNGYETASHKFVKYPRNHPARRQPPRLSDYFEDYYDHLYRDGTGFSNRKGEDWPEDDEQEEWRPITRPPSPVNGSSSNSWVSSATHSPTLDKDYGALFRSTTESSIPLDRNRSSTNAHHYQQLLESFSTVATYGLDGVRHAKREIDGEHRTDEYSEEDEPAGAGERVAVSGMLKSGPLESLRRSREKAVFEMPRKVENPYTKWSKWTKCTAKCTTRRLK